MLWILQYAFDDFICGIRAIIGDKMFFKAIPFQVIVFNDERPSVNAHPSWINLLRVDRWHRCLFLDIIISNCFHKDYKGEYVTAE